MSRARFGGRSALARQPSNAGIRPVIQSAKQRAGHALGK